jgi:hypothetical protein
MMVGGSGIGSLPPSFSEPEDFPKSVESSEALEIRPISEVAVPDLSKVQAGQRVRLAANFCPPFIPERKSPPGGRQFAFGP